MKKCDCDLSVLMNLGCQCGAMEEETCEDFDDCNCHGDGGCGCYCEDCDCDGDCNGCQ